MQEPDASDQSQVELRTTWTFIIIWIAIILAIFVVDSSDLRWSIKKFISQPAEFRIRAKLGRSPALSDRIKIFAFDDSTISYVKDKDLKTADWAKLISNIAKKNPKMILIDKLFSLPPKPAEDLESNLSLIRSANVPIFTGAYLSRQKIAYRNEIQVKDHLSQKNFSINREIEKMPFPKREKAFLYGYAQEYSDVFTDVGHIMFSPKGTLSPLIQLKDNFLPHLTMYVADSLVVDGDGLTINGSNVPLDRDGAITVNHRLARRTKRRAR